MITHFGFSGSSDFLREAARRMVIALRRDFREERMFRKNFPEETLMKMAEMQDQVDDIEEAVKFMQGEKAILSDSNEETNPTKIGKDMKDILDEGENEDEDDWDD